jgi:hypothetical protein
VEGKFLSVKCGLYTRKYGIFVVAELIEFSDSVVNFNDVNALCCTLGHGPRHNIP